MSKTEAFAAITQALEATLGQVVPITPETDLVEEDIVDSLDAMSFLLELETITGKSFPEDGDLVEEGYYRVPFLIEYLQAA
jgi:acyl carrier protein